MEALMLGILMVTGLSLSLLFCWQIDTRIATTRERHRLRRSAELVEQAVCNVLWKSFQRVGFLSDKGRDYGLRRFYGDC